MQKAPKSIKKPKTLEELLKKESKLILNIQLYEDEFEMQTEVFEMKEKLIKIKKKIPLLLKQELERRNASN